MSDSIGYPEDTRPEGHRDELIALQRKTLVVKKLTLTLVILILIGGTTGFAALALRTNTVVTAIRQTQTQNSPIARDTHALVMQFKDCVTPGGACHDKTVRETARSLNSVDHQNRKVSAAAASCSLGVAQNLSQHRRYVLIRHCVNQTLSQ